MEGATITFSFMSGTFNRTGCIYSPVGLQLHIHVTVPWMCKLHELESATCSFELRFFNKITLYALFKNIREPKQRKLENSILYKE
jgi:hypothetical protein